MSADLRRRLPTLLSGSRAVLALGLPFLAGRPVAAVTLMALCAATDVLDGFLARRWDVASERGARADSLADVVFSCAVVVTVLLAVPAVSTTAVPVLVALVAAVVVVRGASVVVSFLRHGRMTFVHTVLNKVAGGALLVGAGAAILGGGLRPVVVAGAVALVAGVEELVIQAAAPTVDPDRRSFFSSSRPRG